MSTLGTYAHMLVSHAELKAGKDVDIIMHMHTLVYGAGTERGPSNY